MEASGRFIIMSYSQLKEWSFRCAEKCKSPRLRYFLEDFESYIRDKFEGGFPIMKKTLVVNQAINPDNISAAVAIVIAWPEIAHQLINRLAELVFKHSGLQRDGWRHGVDFAFGQTGSCIWFCHEDWEHYMYKFSFQTKNVGGFCYGIVKKSEKVQALPADLIKKCDSSLGIGDKTAWWPWSRNFDAPYWDWSSNDQPWIGIKEGGETVEFISDILVRLKEVSAQDISDQETRLAKN
jgi:hypothetical protein